MSIKFTGIVRKVDELGRIVLPKELRDVFKIEHKDPIEIYVDGESIVLRKYTPACVFCGGGEAVTDFEGKKLCAECIEKIKGLN